MLKGIQLEKTAEKVNMDSRNNWESLILKVPVPILITNQGLIPQTSTVDFVGLISGGLFVAYDAKETKNKTSFPLKNIKAHQVDYLNVVQKLGGLSFFMIHFKELYDEVFIAPMSLINRYWRESFKDGRKSIPLSAFKEEAKLVKAEDYIKLITLKNTKEWLKKI